MTKMFSPFEQFELDILVPINLLGVLDMSITNLTVFLVIVLSSILGLTYMATMKTTLIPNRWQSLVEVMYTFVLGLIVEQTGTRDAKKFLPFILSVFLIILTSNLLGLTPFAFTVTSHLSLTFCLSLSFFIGWIILAFKVLGVSFLKIFLPQNVPGWLKPLLLVIELLSFILRPISLAVRLFANMLAGHILLFIISSAIIFLLGVSSIIAGLPFIFVLCFMVLEVGIAFLQAYVFTILLCIYLNDSYNQH
jgi:ATP synthase subunit 6